MPNPVRLRSQYDLVADAPRRLALGRAIIRAKLDAMLRQLNGPSEGEARRAVEELCLRLPAATDANELRGLEGAATRAYYQGFAGRIRVAEFAFKGRSRRPPRDPVNSLLSFAYSLLLGEIQTALLAHGLDPHPGLVHDLGRHHPALASDLVEPYRILVADRFVLWVINRKLVRAVDFIAEKDGGIYMGQDARRVVLDAYERFMERRPGGGEPGAPGTPRRVVRQAAMAMLSVVLGESSELRLPLDLDPTLEAEDAIVISGNETEEAAC